eukprot:2502587-Rhodomonas_salina.4
MTAWLPHRRCRSAIQPRQYWQSCAGTDSAAAPYNLASTDRAMHTPTSVLEIANTAISNPTNTVSGQDCVGFCASTRFLSGGGSPWGPTPESKGKKTQSLYNLYQQRVVMPLIWGVGPTGALGPHDQRRPLAYAMSVPDSASHVVLRQYPARYGSTRHRVRSVPGVAQHVVLFQYPVRKVNTGHRVARA